MPQLRHGIIETTLGKLTLVAEGAALQGLYFPDHVHMPDHNTLGAPVEPTEDDLFAAAHREITEYLTGAREHFSFPFNPQGNDFSQRVWKLLQEIPYGKTTTYGQLAEQMGNRHLAQRVGQVVGRNPISIIIPCHRVIGADGSLTGYAGGLERKRFLLDLEEPTDKAAGRLF